MTRADAQPREPVIVDIAPCVVVESVLERLACYDELARSARDAGPRGRQSTSSGNGAGRGGDLAGERRSADTRSSAMESSAAPAASEAAARAADAEARFGMPDEAPPEERRRRRDRDPVDEITSEVAALREIVPGQLEITLTNGQVWRQTNSDRYRLQVGYPVRVYPTRFGQYYRLTSEILRGFVQVERVR